MDVCIEKTLHKMYNIKRRFGMIVNFTPFQKRPNHNTIVKNKNAKNQLFQGQRCKHTRKLRDSYHNKWKKYNNQTHLWYTICLLQFERVRISYCKRSCKSRWRSGRTNLSIWHNRDQRNTYIYFIYHYSKTYYKIYLLKTRTPKYIQISLKPDKIKR